MEGSFLAIVVESQPLWWGLTLEGWGGEEPAAALHRCLDAVAAAANAHTLLRAANRLLVLAAAHTPQSPSLPSAYATT